jgi:formate dehydrogenase subunit gamma
VALCRAEACQSVGAEALYADTRARASELGDVEVHEVFCLGNCALGPSGTIDGRLHGRLSPERIEALTAGWGS